MSAEKIPAENKLLSDEIRDIVSYRPHWIVRRGNVVFFTILFALFMLSFVIKYPDVINAPAKLAAINPPKPVGAKKEGKLLKLFVSNGQQVNKDQQLGYIESTASFNEVMALQQWVNKTIAAIQDGNYNSLKDLPLPSLKTLGPLQSSYQEFQNQLQYTKQTLDDGYYSRKSGSLQQDLYYISDLKKNASQQQQLIESDQQLQEKEYKAYESLAKDKVIAPLELNQYKSKLIAKQQALKQVNTLITTSDISSLGKKKEILDLKKQVADQRQVFNSALLNLKSTIEEWIEQYVLTAPEDGKVLFISSLHENELIGPGQHLFYIQPPRSRFYVEITASQNGFGKIRLGQKVMLKVESYPSQEFGTIGGIIDHIAEIPNNKDSFLVRVSLPGGLQTSYGKTVFYKNGLRARADIITDDRLLFDRLMGQFRNIWER
jgi:multidrug efflux pump subunit AcrA (membrane-fusion protein)